MTIHVSANTGCNLGCTYCYEEPDRHHSQEDIDAEYDMDLIMERLEGWKDEYPNQTPGFHGGEPLLVRDEHLEQIFEYVDEHWDGSSHVQTNATLIEDHHFDMFVEYDVGIGVSCDGPGELNGNRKARAEMDGDDRDITDRMTSRTHEVLEEMATRDELSGGIIVVLTKANAGTDEKFERLLDWMDWLCRNGLSGHYNPAIPYEDIQVQDSLDPERLKEVYLRTWEWTTEKSYRRWGPMQQYQNNLLGLQLGNCVNNKCDVFNAGSAKIVTGDGSTTGCGKTWDAAGDGNAFLQGPDSPTHGYNETEERYEMLKQTPGVHGDEPDQGGCRGCRYWNLCQGGCPSSGKEYDWRNRTIWCKAKYALYERIEEDMRSMFPGVRLVTDAPWWAPIAEHVRDRHGPLRFNPWKEMQHGEDGQAVRPSVGHQPRGDDDQELVREVLGEGSMSDMIRYYSEEFDPEMISADPEDGSVHADSARIDSPEADD